MSATCRGVRVFRAARWWHPLVSVVVAILVGVVTNVATAHESSWWWTAALVALAIAQVVLMAWQARQDQSANRNARDQLLGQLRPLMPAPTAMGLWKMGWHREALAIWEEAVAIPRPLVHAKPDRYRPYVAATLTKLALGYGHIGELEEMLRVQREAVAMWKACAEQGPQLYSASYTHALTALRKSLAQMGLDQEAIVLDLDN